jgi:broad specificity phosphatase PhoE
MTPERPPIVVIARHGETEWSRSGRHTGRSDIPLTAAGQLEAAALKERLAGRRFALILSSPLSRAWDTCRLAGFGAAAERTDDLLEWDYGAYEGRTKLEIQREVPGWSIWSDGVPGGERLEEVAARANRVIARSIEARGDVLLFAHGHVLRILSAGWLGLPAPQAHRFPLGTGSTGVLGFDGESRVLKAWNHAGFADP